MKKYKYLKRLVIIIFMAVFIPIVAVTIFMWSRSSDELKKGNRVYYEKIADSFAQDFVRRLSELKEHATTIVADSRNRNSVFQVGTKQFKENYFWYYEIVQSLKEKYSKFNAKDFGIYYYDTNRIVTCDGTQSLEQFLQFDLGITKNVPAWDFFASDKFLLNEWVFSSSFSETNQSGDMLIGYCAELGENKDKVLIFYVLDGTEYAKTLNTVYGDNGIHFYVLDMQCKNVLLMIGNGTEGDIQYIKEKAYAGTSTDDMVFYTKVSWLPLCFTVYVGDDSLQNSIIQYYHDMKVAFGIMGIILIGICIVALFLAYKPVYELASEVEDVLGEQDELGSIRGALGERQSKILEQEMLIMDLLLKHLLNGMPISQKRLETLGIDSDKKYYCTYVLQDYVLRASEIENLTNEIKRGHPVRLFCTDLQDENKSILILFMETDVTKSIDVILNQWLQRNVMDDCILIKGQIVDRLDHIRVSFLSCLEKERLQRTEQIIAREEIERIRTKEEQQNRLREDILEYLETHFKDADLSQVKVADEFKISKYTLSRMFKNQIGVGFAEYVNSKRLEYAKELLLTTEYSVRDISAQVGYTSATYFNRIFKATVGVSPTVFREQ